MNRLTVRAGQLVDPSQRRVVLRGFVLVTDDQRGAVELDERNFDQLASWGCNANVIRLAAGRLQAGERAYVDKLDRWTTLAAERGMWTMYKMTTYDMPEMRGPFNPEFWTEFWERDDRRAKRIEGWRLVWERFAGRPETLGYDLVNEPVPGLNGDRLFEFYDAAIAALREIDDGPLAMVQPLIGPHRGLRKVSDAQCAYAPHYYPDLMRECTPRDYDTAMRDYQREAEVIGGALVFGEYGPPNRSFQLGQNTVRAWDETHLRETARVFDTNASSTIRPWYVDDGMWAVCGPGYDEDTPLVNAIVRPFLSRIPGTASWSWDREARKLHATVDVEIGEPLVVSMPARYGETHELRLSKGRHEITV